ncbi:hypothetical protein FQA39_LY08323 [Lamprigera yunnana]|nr:hypothetical protein FQA39_LY08323 [Lamprigera yunnana]
MFEGHMLLRNVSGQKWKGSAASEYLKNLPIGDVRSSTANTRYLLPRESIFTFGFQNGITNPVIYLSCKLCQLLFKIHELKTHMQSKHPNLEITSPKSTPVKSPQLGTKLKKNSHKNKKKVVPPPNVPPPPLFSNMEMTNTATSAPATDNLLPPVLQPVETIKESKSIFIMEINTSVPNILPPTLSTQVPTTKIIRLPAVSILKPKKERLEMHNKHRKSRKRKNDFNPDKHCGVRDNTKQPCLRAITCSNHSILEKRAVRGRSISLDSLITKYKSNKSIVHHIPSVPVAIAPKHYNSAKEMKNGFTYIEVIYDKSSTSMNCSKDVSDSPSEVGSCGVRRCFIQTPRRENNVLQIIKLTDSTNSRNVQQSSHISNVTGEMGSGPGSGKCKSPNGKLLKLKLVPSKTTLPIPKLADSCTPLTPTLYNLHPKPMTMLTGALRRIGGSIILQNAPRLERQRMDLQAVINQHKQLKLSVANKAVLLLNSNHGKQSILKNNVRNNMKANIKRMSMDKTSINEFKHMKVITADLNGILLNTNFSDSSVLQNSDKISLLK